MSAPYVVEIIAGVVLLMRAIEVVTFMGPRDHLATRVTWWALGLGGGGLIVAPFLDGYQQTWLEVLLLLAIAVFLAVDRRRRWHSHKPPSR